MPALSVSCILLKLFQILLIRKPTCSDSLYSGIFHQLLLTGMLTFTVNLITQVPHLILHPTDFVVQHQEKGSRV